jgi:hypothetical protein
MDARKTENTEKRDPRKTGARETRLAQALRANLRRRKACEPDPGGFEDGRD